MEREKNERQKRIEMILESLVRRLEGKKSIVLRDIENVWCLKLGISKRTCREYIDIAASVAGARIFNNEIVRKFK